MKIKNSYFSSELSFWVPLLVLDKIRLNFLSSSETGIHRSVYSSMSELSIRSLPREEDSLIDILSVDFSRVGFLINRIEGVPSLDKSLRTPVLPE